MMATLGGEPATFDLLASAVDAPRFRRDAVPHQLIARLIEVATRVAPPRFDPPPWRFVVVVGPEREELIVRVAEALARHWGLGNFGPRGLASDEVLDAPALVLALSRVPSSEGLEAFAVVAGAVQNLVLAARSAGLATHHIYSANVVPEAVLDFLGQRLGPELRSSELVTLLALGSAAEDDPAIRSPTPAAPISWIGRADVPLPPPSLAPLASSPPAPLLRSLRGDHVLIADPYAFNRDQLAAHLRGAGYVAEAFSHGEALLAHVAGHGQPELYLIAEVLPDMGGFELVRRILSGRGLHAPIIITTARRDSAFRIAGLSAGVDYYLRKPVNPIELFTATRILRVRHRLVVETRRTNHELGRLLGELRATQARLVQQGKMASLGQIVASVAHEINTPLGAVVSNNDLFGRCFARLRTALDVGTIVTDQHVAEQVRRDLAAIQDLSAVTRAACVRITGIVHTLRTFVRVDESEVSPVDLHEGIESTLTLISHLTPANTRILRDYGDIPPVECHANQVNQVFMNLLVNACQAIEDAGVISVRTRREAELVRIEIEDSGAGIAKEHLERLFHSGFTTKDPSTGTGLGLMISAQIIEAHGGTIAVESVLGQGSKFTVHLPIVQPR